MKKEFCYDSVKQDWIAFQNYTYKYKDFVLYKNWKFHDTLEISWYFRSFIITVSKIVMAEINKFFLIHYQT